MKTLISFCLKTSFFMLLLALNGCATTSLENQGMQYSNPSWAPPYYPGVRYYYLPDIETYYDLANQEFVYLDNGQWFFSPALPPVYMGYDLYNAYIIALDRNVYEPWMHHQFYVANYPRFYYRSMYRDREIRDLRGFNENERQPFNWKQEDRDRINELRKNENKERREEVSRPPQNQNYSRPPQNSNYYGRRVGQPVKVQPQMRENVQKNQQSRRR